MHSLTEDNVPGLAQTCAQMRWEVLPIFMAENPSVHFDAGTTQQSCVGNWLRSLGSYADLVSKMTVTLERPMWDGDSFVGYASYLFTIVAPKKEAEGNKAVRSASEQGVQEAGKICDCPLKKLLKAMNKKWTGGERRTGKLLGEFVDSEEFADFVFKVKKTKSWVCHLAKCKKCGEVVFNR
jgi:hypothetical protein